MLVCMYLYVSVHTLMNVCIYTVIFSLLYMYGGLFFALIPLCCATHLQGIRTECARSVRIRGVPVVGIKMCVGSHRDHRSWLVEGI